MKSQIILIGCALVAFALMLGGVACGGGDSDDRPIGPVPETLAARQAVPADLKGKPNSFAGNADAIASGKKLFEENCAKCHGVAGIGDGAEGKALKYRPGNLTDPAFQDVVEDAYIVWRTIVGDAPTGSGMTAFPALKENERWQIAAYVRTLKKK